MKAVSRRSAAMATFVGNGLTVGITVAQAFLLIPLCLTVLGPRVYGAWIAASELLLWVQLLDGGLPNLLMQRSGAAAGRGDYASAAGWTSTTVAGLAIIGSILLVVSLLAAPFVVTWAQVPAEQRDTFVACFRLGALASVILLLSNGYVGLARGVQRTRIINATQVSGALAGLLLSITLLVAGWGLWALAVGLLARSGLALVGGVWLLRTMPRTEVSWWAGPSRVYAREIKALVPSMSTGHAGYLLAHNSEILLVNTFFGPVPALVYALTRRSFDGVRNLLDTIPWAVAGGFAHLVAAEDRHRARTVLHEILWLRLAAACLVTAVVVAINQPFVTLLFGADHFGGWWLTVGFALHIVAGGQSFFANFLWRSTGQMREGSLLLAVEAAVRIAGMSAGLWLMGFAGAPIAAALVSAVVLIVVHKRLSLSLPGGQDVPARWPAVAIPLGVLGVGMIVAAIQVPSSWVAVVAVAVVIGIAGGTLLWFTRPLAVRGSVDRGWSRR